MGAMGFRFHPPDFERIVDAWMKLGLIRRRYIERRYKKSGKINIYRISIAALLASKARKIANARREFHRY
jgi:hypothetical protein